MSAEIGDEVSHRAVWEWVQKSGKAVREEEEQRRQAVFGHGEVFEGEEKLCLSKARHLLVLGDGDPWIENNRDGLYGSRSLKDEVKAEKVLVCSTGAMEKNIDIVIGRRFKKHGMSWTTEGANNLVKLRTLWYNKSDWEAFWRKQSSYGLCSSPN